MIDVRAALPYYTDGCDRGVSSKDIVAEFHERVSYLYPTGLQSRVGRDARGSTVSLFV